MEVKMGEGVVRTVEVNEVEEVKIEEKEEMEEKIKYNEK